MHATMRATPRRMYLYRVFSKKWTDGLPATTFLQACRADSTGSPFAHLRLSTRSNGKILTFKTGNVIRAGKYCHGDACLAAVRFQSWLHHSTHKRAAPWPSAISCPNTVCTGQLLASPSAEVKKDWCATSSNKFPGIAIAVPNNTCTPELFLKEGKFICPGVTTVTSLTQALHKLAELGTKYRV